MKLDVSVLALSARLQKFVEFANAVARRERLTSWTLVLWGGPCEAECDDGRKTIYMGTCPTLGQMKQLFLHEVAHALMRPKGRKDPIWQESFWHGPRWGRNFDRLMKKHLPGVKPNPAIAELPRRSK